MARALYENSLRIRGIDSTTIVALQADTTELRAVARQLHAEIHRRTPGRLHRVLGAAGMLAEVVACGYVGVRTESALVTASCVGTIEILKLAARR